MCSFHLPGCVYGYHLIHFIGMEIAPELVTLNRSCAKAAEIGHFTAAISVTTTVC